MNAPPLRGRNGLVMGILYFSLDFSQFADTQVIDHFCYRMDDKKVLGSKLPALVVRNGQLKMLEMVVLSLVRIVFLCHLEGFQRFDSFQLPATLHNTAGS